MSTRVAGSAGAGGGDVPVGALSRVAVRSISEFVIHVCATLIDAFDGDLDVGVLFITLLRQADLGGRLEGQETAVSINALSRAGARPFETVRRRCNQLCKRGLAERVEAGIRVLPAKLDDPVVRELRASFVDHFVMTLGEMKRLGYPLPRAAPEIPFDRVALEQGALDMLLLTMEFGIPPHPHPNWLKPLLYMAVMVANARPFTFDPELALRYASVDTPPPDSLRRPVSASAVARGVGLPYATVRRNLEAIAAGGQMRRVEGGYLIEMAWMQSPASVASGAAMVTQLHRLVRRLELGGFPFDAPEKAYVRGRPERIAFD